MGYPSYDFTFNQYSRDVADTAIYPDSGERTNLAINYTVLGISGEAGELPNKWKKVFRDDNGVLNDARRMAMLDELGDVLWYAARLATELGTSLEEVARGNIDKLRDRKARDALSGSGDNR